MARLDILIPYYNGRYILLIKLLDSIKAQKQIKWSDINVIIINDGSTSTYITDDLYKNYPFKIDYTIKSHDGIALTRNALLKRAKSDYLLFCDQDDYFCSDLALYLVIQTIKKYSSDIIITSTRQEYLEPTTQELKSKVLSATLNNINGTLLHGRAFKRSFINQNNLCFLSCFEGAEDYYFVGLALQLATSIRFIPEITYIWTYNKDSFTRQDKDWEIKCFCAVIKTNYLIVHELLAKKLFTQAYLTIEQLFYEAYLKFNYNKSYINNQASKLDQIKFLLYNYYTSYKKYIKLLDTDLITKLYINTPNITPQLVYTWFINFTTELAKHPAIAIQNSFSIIIPTHNRKNTLKNAIDSILSQDYTNYEIIVIDDASTDNTKQFIIDTYSTELLSGKIKYILNNSAEHSSAIARNIGLKQAKNDWIAYLDDDNIQYSNFLFTFNLAINQHLTTKCFYARWINQYNKAFFYYFNPDQFNFEKLNTQNFIDIGVFVHSKTLVSELGTFNSLLTRLIDWDLILKYTNKYTPVAIDNIVLSYYDCVSANRITTTQSLENNISLIPSYYSDDAPSITALILTYNHEQFIEKAIQSAIYQRGNFKYSILISDDCSTDTTASIIDKYAKLYPNLVKIISPNTHCGINENYRQAIAQVTSDYVAVLEGDDYWLNPFDRLSLLLKHFTNYDNLKFVFTKARLLSMSAKQATFVGETNSNLNKYLISADDLYSSSEFNFIKNWSTAIFKTKYLKQIPDDIYLDYTFSEIPVQFALLQTGGYAYFEPAALSVYRLHSNGLWSGADPDHKLLLSYENRRSAYNIALYAGKKALYSDLISRLEVLISKGLKSQATLLALRNDFSKLNSSIDNSNKVSTKGIILAGGKGTRLYPLTSAVCKPLLPVYDKPMIYYSLSTLMLAGIRDILIISTPDDLVSLKKLLGNGNKFGINLSYTIQEKPNGIAEAFLLGSNFIENNSCVLVLGDNIFYGNGLVEKLKLATKNILADKATIFGYYVTDPERFGIIELDNNNKPISIEEKPKQPKSNYCVTGLYFYPSGVAEKAKMLKPSLRNELEITDLNKLYLDNNTLEVQLLGRGNLWFDTGTPDSLLEASNCIRTIQSHQNLQICCPEEIAYNNGWITATELLKIADNLSTTNYGNYLKTIAKNNENEKF